MGGKKRGKGGHGSVRRMEGGREVKQRASWDDSIVKEEYLLILLPEFGESLFERSQQGLVAVLR